MTKSSQTEGIGWRVAKWRGLARLTQQEVADAMGVHRSYISLIESGQRQVVNRRQYAALARALGVSVEDLTGQPVPPRTREEMVLYSLPALLRPALDLEGDAPPPRPLEVIAGEVDRSFGMRMHHDWEALTALLPGLLAETMGLASTPGRMLAVRALVNASLTCRTGGYLDLARRCAERAASVAGALGEPVHLGGAAFALGQAALAGGSIRHALAVTELAGQALQADLPAGEEARATAGMLHLASALAAAAHGDLARTHVHLEEATYLAQGMVGNPWWYDFNPANVGCWRVAAACELGEFDRGPELAAQVQIPQLRTPDRVARLNVDVARCEYETQRPERAVARLLVAMDVSARGTRVLPPVRELVAQMARDAGPGGGSEGLRRLVTSVGVPLVT